MRGVFPQGIPRGAVFNLHEIALNVVDITLDSCVVRFHGKIKMLSPDGRYERLARYGI